MAASVRMAVSAVWKFTSLRRRGADGCAAEPPLIFFSSKRRRSNCSREAAGGL